MGLGGRSLHEPSKLRVADPRSGPRLCEAQRFMVPVRDCEVVEASHEPQKVAQASCLFGADRLEACPTLQPAARFMAPTHVQFLEVSAAHEPWWGETPSSPNFCSWEIRARRSLAPPGSWKAPFRFSHALGP